MKNLYKYILAILLCTVGVYAAWCSMSKSMMFKTPIKIGVIHSLTGDLSLSEGPLVDAITLAIEEINAKGGVLGRPIKPIIRDGGSDDVLFAKYAQELIEQENVVALFGGWSSGSRKMIKPIVEEKNNLLFYSVDTEGLEESPNIVYISSAPNQALIPGITWCFYNLGKKFFLVGSSDIYSYAMNTIIKYHAAMLGATIVGEAYVSERPESIAAAIEQIKKTQPSVIINSIDGLPNKYFFPALRAAGINSSTIPTMSLSISEYNIVEYGIAAMVGDYGVSNYFQTINRQDNLNFIERFKKRFGKTRVVGTAIEAAYNSVYLWANSVNAAESTDTQKVVEQVKQQVFSAPGGIIYVDENQYAWLQSYIGRILYDGSYAIVWQSKKNIHPEPYPPYQSKEQWDAYIMNLYKEWGNKWQNY